LLPNEPPREHTEMNNRLPLAQETAASHTANDAMDADNLLIEARPFLQVLASIITRLYGERSEETSLTEQDEPASSI
jgi:hypothetical protein